MLLLLLTGVSGFAHADQAADQLAEGIKAFLAGDYQKGGANMRALAVRGFAGAQFNLGVMGAHGQGVPQNDVVSCVLYNLSAAQGYS